MNCSTVRSCVLLASFVAGGVSALPRSNAAVIPIWSTPDQTVVTLPPGGTATFRAEGYLTSDFDALLLFDTSGSMNSAIPADVPAARNGGRRRYDWALDGSDDFIDFLADEVSLGLVDFDGSARLVVEVSELGPWDATPSHRTELKASLRTLNQSGNTNIANAIAFASEELLNRPNRSDSLHLVLVTDGQSNSAFAYAATLEAIDNGIDSINTIALPGADTTTLSEIANLGQGVFVDGTDLTQLLERFRTILNEAESLDHLDIELPDGSMLSNVPINLDGSFAVEGLIQEGDNVFRAHATSSLGNVVVRDLHVIGQTVPEPSAFELLTVAVCLAGAFAWRRAGLHNPSTSGSGRQSA